MKQKFPFFNDKAWNVFAGGTAVPEGVYSYSWREKDSSTIAYINPVMRDGKVRYAAMFWHLSSEKPGYSFVVGEIAGRDSFSCRSKAWKALKEAFESRG